MKLSRVFSVLPSLFLPSRALPHHPAWIIVKWAARPAEARRRWFAKPIRSITTATANSLIGWRIKSPKPAWPAGVRAAGSAIRIYPLRIPLPPRHIKGQRSIGSRSRASGAARRTGRQRRLAGVKLSFQYHPAGLRPESGRGRGWRIRSAPSPSAATWRRCGPLPGRCSNGISPPCPPRPRWSFPAATGRLFLSAPVRIKANTRRFCWIRQRPKAPVL